MIYSTQLKHEKKIHEGAKFWGYLDTKALLLRYHIASYYLGNPDIELIVEIGGYRTTIGDVYGFKDCIVYSLDMEFEECDIRGLKCIRDQFQNHVRPERKYALILLGLEPVHGAIEPLYDWIYHAELVILEASFYHEPSVNLLHDILLKIPHEEIAKIHLDFSKNREAIMASSICKPFLERNMVIFKPLRRG